MVAAIASDDGGSRPTLRRQNEKTPVQEPVSPKIGLFSSRYLQGAQRGWHLGSQNGGNGLGQ